MITGPVILQWEISSSKMPFQEIDFRFLCLSCISTIQKNLTMQQSSITSRTCELHEANFFKCDEWKLLPEYWWVDGQIQRALSTKTVLTIATYKKGSQSVAKVWCTSWVYFWSKYLRWKNWKWWVFWRNSWREGCN